MIVDITLNQMKKLSTSTSQLLRYETNDLIYLYYVQQGPVIFRAIISRPTDVMEYNLLISGLPNSLRVLNVIEDGVFEKQTADILQDILTKLEKLDGHLQNGLS